MQLQALIVQARANLKLAKVTYDRWKRLAAAGVFSKQESDEREAASDARQADLEAAQANLNATEKTVEANAANVRRLENLKSFAHITAPFDGIITARNIDVGTLVNAGNGGARAGCIGAVGHPYGAAVAEADQGQPITTYG